MEEWRDIEGYEGFYQVSNLGRIKSLSRKRIIKGGGFCITKTRILKTCLIDGYPQTVFCVNSKFKVCRVHREVAKAFIPNPGNKPCTNHKNSIRSDNRVENLEWCTVAENVRHAAKNGRMPRGETHHKSKLNEFQVRVIRKATDISNSEFSDAWGVGKFTINCIRKNKTWKHVL